MAKDKPRYYTTDVDPRRSLEEIREALAETGKCKQFGSLHDGNDNPYALRFVITSPEVGDVPVQLESHAERIENRYDYDPERARRIAWRQMKHYVETQIMMIESELKKPHEAFLDDALMSDDGYVITCSEFYADLVHSTEGEGPPRLPGRSLES